MNSRLFKHCNRCDRDYPATPEYFYRAAKSPDGLAWWCKACHKAYLKGWREENPEKNAEYDRRYYQQDKSKSRAWCRNWRLRNREYWNTRAMKYYYLKKEHDPEGLRERRRKEHRIYYAKHREEVFERSRLYKKKHPEKVRQYQRNWYRRDPAKKCAANQRRRALKLNASGFYTDEDVLLQLKSQKGLCWWCGEPLGDKYHVDHRIPLTRGGSNDPRNIVITHIHCNLSKHDKLPHEWNGRLL